MSTEKAGKKKVATFFSSTLWELDPETYPKGKKYAIKYLQIMALVIRDFWADQCMLRATALSFTTILSIVPFFALTFAVLKGLGVPNRLEPFILSEVTAGSKEVVDRIISYINNTNMTTVGAIGLLALIVTAVTLLGNIEEAFNLVWGVKETRSLYRKFSDYLSVLVSAPLLMLAAVSVATTLSSQTAIQWVIRNTYLGDLLLYGIRFLQHFSVWAALVFLYIFIPNTKVRFKSAVVGGIMAGTLWQIIQWGYVNFQVGVSRYNAIYGTLSVLPIFLIWIYTSWIIVLFGVEVVCAHQNIRTFRRELRISLCHGLKELLSLAILQRIAEGFFFGSPPLTVEDLAEELDIPVRIVRELLDLLRQGGYVVETAGEDPSFQPARDLERIFIIDVLRTLKNIGGVYKIARISKSEKVVTDILTRVDASSAAAIAGMTVKDLIEPFQPVQTARDI